MWEDTPAGPAPPPLCRAVRDRQPGRRREETKQNTTNTIAKKKKAATGNSRERKCVRDMFSTAVALRVHIHMYIAPSCRHALLLARIKTAYKKTTLMDAGRVLFRRPPSPDRRMTLNLKRHFFLRGSRATHMCSFMSLAALCSGLRGNRAWKVPRAFSVGVVVLMRRSRGGRRM